MSDDDPTAAQRELLTAVLRRDGELGAGDRVTAVRQLAGGYSRHTYLAAATLASGGGGERSYVVRVKVPHGLFDTDLQAEYRIFDALTAHDVRTPRVFGFHADDDDTDSPFGGPFFAMDHLPGDAPNLWRAQEHTALRADWEGPRGIARDVVTNLARIHTLDVAPLAGVVPRLTFADQVARWRDVHERAGLTRDPITREAFHWLAAHEPPQERGGLVHGDFRLGNLLLQDGRVSGILDWELAHHGDVRFDLGYLALAYTAGKHLRPKTTLLGGVADPEWFLTTYEELTGAPVDRDAVRTFSVLGAVALISLAFTGMRRYVDGETSDMRRVWIRFTLPGLRQDLAELMAW